jgi:hypothetical protein
LGTPENDSGTFPNHFPAAQIEKAAEITSALSPKFISNGAKLQPFRRCAFSFLRDCLYNS